MGRKERGGGVQENYALWLSGTSFAFAIIGLQAHTCLVVSISLSLISFS